jgi:hypothetical protein
LRGGRAKQDDHLRLHRSQLRLQPWPARFDFRHPRFLVNPPLAARLPFEMLHGVGDVHVAAWDPRVLERLVEHRTGRADKGRPLTIFLIARLLADKHYARVFGPRTENDLGGGFVQVAPAAFMRRRAQGSNTARWRDKWRRRALTAGLGIVRARGCLLRHLPTSGTYCTPRTFRTDP